MRLPLALTSIIVLATLSTVLEAKEESGDNKLNPLTLSGRKINLKIDDDLSLIVSAKDEKQLWRSAQEKTPVIVTRPEGKESRTLLPSEAGKVSTERYTEGKYQGYKVRLSDFEGADDRYGVPQLSE